MSRYLGGTASHSTTGGHTADSLSHAPVRSAWLGFLPVAALEDRLRQMKVETEEANIATDALCLEAIRQTDK